MAESYLKGQHRGLHRYRFTDNPEEKLFADAWEERCNRGHLEWSLGNGAKRALDVTERDALVAATVIQWLGSPVGQGFLRDLGYIKMSKESKEKDHVWWCKKILEQHPDKVKMYHGGKTVLGFLIGQVMKESGGPFDPKLIHEELFKLLNKNETY